MTNTSVTLQEAGIAAAVDEGGRYESARNKMMALDFATQLQEMKAIAGPPDFALGSHAFVAAAAAEAAAMQDRFWAMHELHFHRQKALEEDDLRHASRFCAGCFGAPGWPETVASLIPDMGYVPVRVGTLAESLDPGGAPWARMFTPDEMRNTLAHGAKP